jgi:cholestenol delta-isomerase
MMYFIIKSHPCRYPLQAIVSLGQVYGDVLYYATNLFDHYYKSLSYCRPEAYYYWFYFVFMNAIWIVIPGGEYVPCLHLTLLTKVALLADSIITTAKAFKALDRMSHSLQANGKVTKPRENGHAKRA